MEQPNQWFTHTKEEDLAAYMYQQEGSPVPLAGMAQHFTEPPLAEHQERYYTQPMAIAPFNPSCSSHFPSFGGSSSLPNLPFRSAMPVEELGQPSLPRLSNFLSFGAGQPSRLNFSGGACWQHDGVQGTAQQLQMPERRGRDPASAQEHVIAERKRREKLQQQFVSLATIIPGIKKTDKLSLLGSTIDYVKQLKEKMESIEEQRSRRPSESMVFDSKCRTSAADNGAAGPSGSGFRARDNEDSSQAIDARIRGNMVLLNICCKKRRGVLVIVLSELENEGLSIINTNVIPFTDSCFNITITAKIEEGFSSAVDVEVDPNSFMKLRGNF